MEPFEPLRGALSEQAAVRGAAAVQAQLRLVTTAELLCPAPPPVRTTDLSAELDALCAALTASVRRRPGWLYYAPAGAVLPVLARPRLLQAAVLCMLRGVLHVPGGRAVVTCRMQGGAAELTLRGGTGGFDAPALLRQLAREAGGCAVIGAGAPFAAALRLPLCTALPPRPSPTAGELLRDKYSLPYIYLGRDCAADHTLRS